MLEMEQLQQALTQLQMENRDLIELLDKQQKMNRGLMNRKISLESRLKRHELKITQQKQSIDELKDNLEHTEGELLNEMEQREHLQYQKEELTEDLLSLEPTPSMASVIVPMGGTPSHLKYVTRVCVHCMDCVCVCCFKVWRL